MAERTGSYAVRVRELLTKLNPRPFRKRDGSRATAFEAIDKPALKPLPMEPFNIDPDNALHIRRKFGFSFVKNDGTSSIGGSAYE